MKSIVTLVLIIMPILAMAYTGETKAVDSQTKQIHPRIFSSNSSKANFLKIVDQVQWKKEFVEKKKKYVETYLQYCADDPQWLVSRLQMNWKTKHSNVYLKGGDFSHSDGEAPVPTVRFSGTRDWATDYFSPSLENVTPYFDDARGFFLEHRKSHKKMWVHPSETGHMIEKINERIMSIAADAAFLYWLTDDDKYAALAAPVFSTYMEGMYYRNPPLDINKTYQNDISGLATFEVIHESILPHLAVCYDYLFSYFHKEHEDLSHAVAVFQKWGDQIIKNGIPDNNWNLFQARFLTYVALVLDGNDKYDNGKGQEYYLKHTFDVSTPRQIAIKESVLNYDQETGIWPEAASYSMHVNTTFLEILTLLDNTTNANELANFPMVEKAALACFQYLFPSGYIVGFGDSHHSPIPFENFELLIANYHKYKQEEKELAITQLLTPLINKGEYKRELSTLFELFFYVDELKDQQAEQNTNMGLITPTFYAPNVSLFIQRLGVGENATMVSTTASYGNHTHANGISIELFANKYVLGPDMGRGSSYWSPDFREYYSQMPAHNTVVVDGKSTYANMRSYNPFSLDQCYPRSGTPDPLFKKVSFSKVSFVEPKTQSDQQRLTAIVNTDVGKPYILDVFRSRKIEGGEQKHEYFYHNIAHSLTLYDKNNRTLSLMPTDELSSENGLLKAYDYLMDEKSIAFEKDANAIFKIENTDEADNIMRLWIKGNEKQTIFSVNSPKSNVLSKGTAPSKLIDAKVPTLILRREDEAWRNPYVLVFDPYMEDAQNPIKNIDFSCDPKAIENQIITVEHSDNVHKDMFWINTTRNSVYKAKYNYLRGLMAVTRLGSDMENPEFMFVSGAYQYRYNDWNIRAIGKCVTVSVEQKTEGFEVQNDAPVLILVPIRKNHIPRFVRLFNNDGTVLEREGHISRSNPHQMEFRLDKAYTKAEIIVE